MATVVTWTMGFQLMSYGHCPALVEDPINSTRKFTPNLALTHLVRKNIGINDVCGDFSLTLIDTLDTLAVCLLRQWERIAYIE
jgi:hypothetical protein